METGDVQTLQQLVLRHEWIDVIQTAAIVAVFAVLVYAIWRLERQVRAWARMLAEINVRLTQAPEGTSNVVRDWVGVAFQRLVKIEARLDAIEKGEPPPAGTGPRDPPLGRPDLERPPGG